MSFDLIFQSVTQMSFYSYDLRFQEGQRLEIPSYFGRIADTQIGASLQAEIENCAELEVRIEYGLRISCLRENGFIFILNV